VYNDGKEDKDKKNYVLVPPSVVNINGEYVFKGGIKTIKDDNLNRKFSRVYKRKADMLGFSVCIES